MLAARGLREELLKGSDSPPTALDGGLDKNLNMPSLPRLEVQAEGQRDEPVHAYAPASQRIDRSITRLARRRVACLGAVLPSPTSTIYSPQGDPRRSSCHTAAT